MPWITQQRRGLETSLNLGNFKKQEIYCLSKGIFSQPRIRHCDLIRVYIFPTR